MESGLARIHGRHWHLALPTPRTLTTPASNATPTLQAKHSHHHRRMQQQAQQQKARDRAQAQSSDQQQQSRRRQQSQHHQWLHHQHIRNDRALPAPPPTSQHRERDDTIAEGSTGKQQAHTAERQALERPTTRTTKSKMRINAIKFTTKDGKQMETTSNDTEEIENERILLEPIIHDTEDLDPQQVAQGMKKEVHNK